MPVKGPLLIRVGSGLAVVLALACCTSGGQFDPTEVVNSDVFSTKKKLAGDREPLFPNGVPGAETGVPPDLVKGYQPAPEPPAAAAEVPPAAAAGKSAAATHAASAAPATPAATTAAATPAKQKPKAKPKPKVAGTPAPSQDPVWNQKAAQPPQTQWPAPPPPASAQQMAQPAQTDWPPPPSNVPAQQAAQPGQPIWPNPPAPGTNSH